VIHWVVVETWPAICQTVFEQPLRRLYQRDESARTGQTPTWILVELRSDNNELTEADQLCPTTKAHCQDLAERRREKKILKDNLRHGKRKEQHVEEGRGEM